MFRYSLIGEDGSIFHTTNNLEFLKTMQKVQYKHAKIIENKTGVKIDVI